MRAVSLWGAASAVGAAAGPLVGGLLVDSTGWQGLFWIDAAIAACCIPVTLRAIEESRDPNRPRSIDWFGTVLVATILAPMILAVTKGSEWGWTSGRIVLCLLVSIVSVVGFVVVERRSPAPLVDLELMRNKLLIGATLGILIGAGTINGLMFVVSLYFQDPSALGMSARSRPAWRRCRRRSGSSCRRRSCRNGQRGTGPARSSRSASRSRPRGSSCSCASSRRGSTGRS